MKIEHDGHTISQNDESHHVMILQGGHMVLHAQCDKPMTEEELIEVYNRYLKMLEVSDEF